MQCVERHPLPRVVQFRAPPVMVKLERCRSSSSGWMERRAKFKQKKRSFSWTVEKAQPPIAYREPIWLRIYSIARAAVDYFSGSVIRLCCFWITFGYLNNWILLAKSRQFSIREWVHLILGSLWVARTLTKQRQGKNPQSISPKWIRVRYVHYRDQQMPSRDSNPGPR